MRAQDLTSLATTILHLSAGAASAATESGSWDHRFPAEEGMSVLVDVSFHDVEITARPGDTIDVTVDVEVSASARRAGRLLDELTPEFREDGDRLVIRSVPRRGLRLDPGGTSTRGLVRVSMPPGLDLSCDTSSGECAVIGDLGGAAVTCDTSSGDVRVDGAMRTLTADTSSGNVRVTVRRPLEELRADTSSGDVRLVGGTRDAWVDTSSGSVDLRGLLGDAKVDTSSGDVHGRWISAPPDTTVRVDTSSGEVSLVFPAGTRLAGEVDTSSGDIRSDFPGDWSDRGRHLSLGQGPGAVRLEVDTTSGEVELLAER